VVAVAQVPVAVEDLLRLAFRAQAAAVLLPQTRALVARAAAVLRDRQASARLANRLVHFLFWHTLHEKPNGFHGAYLFF